MTRVHEVMINKLKEHTTLSRKEVAALRTLPVTLRSATSSDDLVRQGERPDVSMVVLTGMVARYHTLQAARGNIYPSISQGIGQMPKLFLSIKWITLSPL